MLAALAFIAVPWPLCAASGDEASAAALLRAATILAAFALFAVVADALGALDFRPADFDAADFDAALATCGLATGLAWARFTAGAVVAEREIALFFCFCAISVVSLF